MKRLLIFFPLLVLSFYNCANKNADPQPVIDSVFTAKYNINTLLKDTAFNKWQTLAALEDKKLDEISGIAASRTIPDAIWTEEDSGNEPKIYLVGTDGITKATFKLSKVTNIDWEDMAIAPGPVAGKDYLYVGEIGDNYKMIPFRSIYRFPEPDLKGKTFPVTDSISKIDIINYKYPDGPHDAEALMIDPLTKDIYIITKEETMAGLYVARYPQATNTVITLKKLGTLPFPKIVAADISSDGKEILLKDYTEVYYWKRDITETISKTLQKAPTKVPYLVEPQGEAVAWAADASGYFTLSEKANGNDNPTVYFYKRK